MAHPKMKLVGTGLFSLSLSAGGMQLPLRGVASIAPEAAITGVLKVVVFPQDKA